MRYYQAIMKKIFVMASFMLIGGAAIKEVAESLFYAYIEKSTIFCL